MAPIAPLYDRQKFCTYAPKNREIPTGHGPHGPGYEPYETLVAKPASFRPVALSSIAVLAVLNMSPRASIANAHDAGSPVTPVIISALEPAVRVNPGREWEGAPRSSASPNSLRWAQSQTVDFEVRDTSGDPSEPVLLPIILPSGIQNDYTFIMIRGLPAGFKLSAGFPTRDAWAVSLRDVPSLTLTAPANFEGALYLDVSLVRGRDVPPETRRLTVMLRRTPDRMTTATTTAAKTTTGSGSQILTAAPPPSVGGANSLLKDLDDDEKTGLVLPPTGVSDAEEKALMQRASGLLKNGDVAGARLLYENLAMRGSAKGAFSLGQTYDPDFLKTIFVKGMKADIETAKKWYQKAAELGYADAKARLSTLETR